MKWKLLSNNRICNDRNIDIDVLSTLLGIWYICKQSPKSYCWCWCCLRLGTESHLSRNVAFSKQKKYSLRTVPTIQGQDSHFRFVKWSRNQTTVQTFSGWLHHQKNTQKRINFPVPLIHLKYHQIKDFHSFHLLLFL